MERCSATSCRKIAILQGWVIGYCKQCTLSYEGLCLLNGLACAYNCPKTQVGQESSKSTCCLKNIANKAAKCALNAANTMEPNIVAKKRCGPKEAMRRTFMQGAFSLLVFSSSPDSLLQSHFFVSLGAPGVVHVVLNTKCNIRFAAVGSRGWGMCLYVYTEIKLKCNKKFLMYTSALHVIQKMCIYIYTFLPHEGMPQKHSHKCKPCRIICKCTGLSQVKIFKLCTNTESSQIAMPYQST